jgi:hypothetical protein
VAAAVVVGHLTVEPQALVVLVAVVVLLHQPLERLTLAVVVVVVVREPQAQMEVQVLLF